eukprot:TRINITY_DN74073_c0_g1_i1.p1 TRINITY_DN74073_c0_g1~~TRINITY_DN74073_c0_g1_i1.p1  ORF type:complete len:361 (-),score=47.38 TRINITY_DN74073_c0_g1_i1:21-1103(-)
MLISSICLSLLGQLTDSQPLELQERAMLECFLDNERLRHGDWLRSQAEIEEHQDSELAFHLQDKSMAIGHYEIHPIEHHCDLADSYFNETCSEESCKNACTQNTDCNYFMWLDRALVDNAAVETSQCKCFFDCRDARRNYITEAAHVRVYKKVRERPAERLCPEFKSDTATLFTSWGLGETDFSEEIVVDLGGGSTLRSTFFQGARLVVIEPLAAKMFPHVPSRPHFDFHDPSKVWRLYGMHGEFRACEIEGQASLVLSINALDHGWRPERTLRNAARMLRGCGSGRRAVLIVSVDLSDHPVEGHPQILSRRWFHEQANATNLGIFREFPQLVWTWGDQQRMSYAGHGGAAWTFMMRRRC